MSDGVIELQQQVADLSKKLEEQEARQSKELAKLQGDLQELRGVAQTVERRSSSSNFVRKVEWTISDFAEQKVKVSKGSSTWSPRFDAAGVAGLQLEFFPNGREKTTFDGFCSLFLWCPSGWRVKYQLFVGSFLRAPDVDEFPDSIGHGHSNFCPIAPEVDTENDRVVIGVVFLEVSELSPPLASPIRLVSRPVEAMVNREADVVANKSVNKVIWKVTNASKRIAQLPRGASMYSPLFTAAGIREVLLEFYPNGSTQTQKDGYRAFYVRCTPGASMVITLFVGKSRKGPIKTTFDGLAGKGLPEFCLLSEQLNAEDDSVQVGIELQSQHSGTLQLES